ncbi:MAG: DUF484 family protein [Alphaproteobacteria bacterium]|nr:DUF484 family protein [Alphaproteobacteria bacterium]MBV9153223.1 DUF484 family protein [Alphaproteobacteria bacterium]MBV9586720.1 DUF484 family protein [Alphaproteobacteria bacterium]MBV9966791.1 DUF484 family protein [Alphaproteobacteria bacterium]
MVDRPRDKRQIERDAALAPVGPQQIGSREVIAFLKQHPDFLDRHPEALRLLRAPMREVGEGVFDFQHFMIERLRDELARVNLEHRTLIAASRGNLASQGRVHKAALAILGAPSFEQLLQIVTTDLAVLLDVDIVTLAVESTASPTRLMPHGIHLLKAGTADALLGADRNVLLQADLPGDVALFGGAAGLVRSQALLRVSIGRSAPTGLLCIGARRVGRFNPGLGAELLGFLGRVLGITIAQWLSPGR